jgi:hypothetical protein
MLCDMSDRRGGSNFGLGGIAISLETRKVEIMGAVKALAAYLGASVAIGPHLARDQSCVE